MIELDGSGLTVVADKIFVTYDLAINIKTEVFVNV